MTICILGNNLTALTLAKALTNQNIYVDILFSKKNLDISKTRTIGISKSNIDFLNENVICIKKLLWNLKKIEIYSDNLKKEKLINFEKNDEQIFSIIKNYKFYQLLKNNLSKNRYFKSKLVSLKNLTFINKYDFIINCESSNIVTRKFFSKKLLKEYNSKAYTTLITHEKIQNDVAVQIFTSRGPLAFLPVSNTQTSIVYSIPNSITETNENIEKLIREKNKKYKIKNIEKLNNFKLKSLNLRSYYHKNILSFGDMLHTIHPLAGQGFNMTVRDLKILLEIIKKKIDVGLPLDKSINVEFQNKAKHKNLIFSYSIDMIHKIFNFEKKTKSKFLSKSIQLVFKQPHINKVFSKIADKGAIF